MEELIEKLGQEVRKGKTTWASATTLINEAFGTNLTQEAVRKRYQRINRTSDKADENRGEYKTIYGDGTVEAQRIVNLKPEQKDNPRAVLIELGYNPDEWELVMMTFSNWQQHTKEQTTKELYAVKFKIRPKVKEYNPNVFLEVAKELFEKDIKPMKFVKPREKKELNQNTAMLIGGVELHLGKEARTFDVGEEYNVDIACQRYYKIVETICQEQELRKANKLFYGIGNDFINIDTPVNTTTAGTPQDGALSSKELFAIGLDLQIKSLLTLKEIFGEIEIILTEGNHSSTLEYCIYMALKQRFINDNILKFRDDYKDVQAIEFGKTSVFLTHGEQNYKRLLQTLSDEFHEIYGKTINRYVLLGHLHTEKDTPELNGFTVYRLSSPSGIDRWHYKNRYKSKVQQQIFEIDKEEGLKGIRIVPFQKVIKK